MNDCNVVKNQTQCNCSYPCSKKGVCCECVEYHRNNNELPACYFNAKYEATYDRSVRSYLKMLREK